MSLLGSIFGSSKASTSKKAGKAPEVSEMFDHSTELPDRPQHVAPKRESKRKVAAPEESPAKKQRKPRKAKQSKEESEKTDAQTEEQPSEEADSAEKRTIFVGNLPLKSTTRKTLASLFRENCGAVESTRIRSVPGLQGVKLPPQRAGDQNLVKKVSVNQNLVDFDNAAKETVQGYVVFKNVESVEKALALNNELVVDGRTIRIDRASPTVDPSRSVFCGNLPYEADEESLKLHFQKGCDLESSDIEGVRIVRDKETYRCKGFGYVLFKEKSTVATALKLHETTYMKNKIRVLVCGKRFKNKKGKEQNSESKAPVSGTATAPKETVTVGAFRRIIAKQKNETTTLNKRKRGETKKGPKAKKATGQAGLSKRAALDKKVEKRVKKIQKRISKGMGKARK
eukprot:Nitzschia sp. Nitz4//scaffold12_size214221//140850//142043//NITZ4_001514-RA/size214221-processed-gene-0.122-mRNA-1//1//CDS//3329535062//6483//frame0